MEKKESVMTGRLSKSMIDDLERSGETGYINNELEKLDGDMAGRGEVKRIKRSLKEQEEAKA